jgi:hypothetical protein
MNKLWAILDRLSRVIYVLLLLAGLGVGLSVWDNHPFTYKTYKYKVECNNGQSFDPTAKPIDKSGYLEPYVFDDLQVKSECEYGTAYNVGLSNELPRNYSLVNQSQTGPSQMSVVVG